MHGGGGPPSSPMLSRHHWLRHHTLRQGIHIGIHPLADLLAESHQKRLLLKQAQPMPQAQQVNRCAVQMPRFLLTPCRPPVGIIAIWCGYSGHFLRFAGCGLRDF